ncbi:hypothetical protein [Paludisphaera mucosa]|uniref:Uncharacterized protein n=1 Tax=Paludisphaera mucosa TaxID=3030827 RepID=A0ABT6F6V6_9BACT|nr:hypothetical protein [Paludisphaera mucosa]MDG3003254.1 hypothetical protein [Paludisphaera mucosa]
MAEIPPGGTGLTLLSGLTTPHRVVPSTYHITGDVESGYRAFVEYLVLWADAFVFVDEVMGLSTAATVYGAITYHAPHRLPFTTAALYAHDFDLTPCGIDGDAVDDASMPNLGLFPGEYFSYAKVTVTYQTPGQGQAPGEGTLQQLDPSNPITVCRQTVRSSGKMDTSKAGSFQYTSDSKTVPGEHAIPSCESVLDLEFPAIPYLPWQAVRPYINKVNSVAVLNCGIGELLLEGMTTRVEATTQGFSQNLVLSFAVAGTPGVTWNMLPRDGVPVAVKRAGSGAPIFASADFRDIFTALDRS